MGQHISLQTTHSIPLVRRCWEILQNHGQCHFFLISELGRDFNQYYTERKNAMLKCYGNPDSFRAAYFLYSTPDFQPESYLGAVQIPLPIEERLKNASEELPKATIFFEPFAHTIDIYLTPKNHREISRSERRAREIRQLHPQRYHPQRSPQERA